MSVQDREDEIPEWTDEERSLLHSALDDEPRSGSLRGTLRAVAAVGAVASVAESAAATTAALKPAAATAVASLAKWTGVVAIGGALAAGGGIAFFHAATRPSVVVAPTGPTHPETVTPPVPSPLVTAIENVDTAKAAAPEPAANAERKSSGALHAEAPLQPDIAEEVRSLDAVRAALRAGRASEALSALDGYTAKYGRKGSFAVEATVLRIEALSKSGDSARATALANAFLSAHPKSPYAARIRARLGATDR